MAQRIEGRAKGRELPCCRKCLAAAATFANNNLSFVEAKRCNSLERGRVEEPFIIGLDKMEKVESR